MRICIECGQAAPWLVPPGHERCLGCMDDGEVDRVDLGLMAEELDAELLEWMDQEEEVMLDVQESVVQSEAAV